MSAVKDGGSAFPIATIEFRPNPAGGGYYVTKVDGGMSLRDYFAAQALVAVMRENYANHDLAPREVAADAYLYADAMLAAREEQRR